MANSSELEPELDKAVRIYREFMEEIKVRFGVIAAIVDEFSTKPMTNRSFLQAEMAFLQFRLICEALTMATLAAHQPSGLADGLMDSWNARLALKELAKLNPECFPRPLKVTRVDDSIQIEVEEKGALTRLGFIRYYMKCGRNLHRGVVRHAFEGTARVYDIDALDRWAKRLGALLANHTILILDEGIVLMVHMHGGENGSVLPLVAKGDGPARLVKSGDPKPSPRRGK